MNYFKLLFCSVVLMISSFMSNVTAQPFTLKENIKPIQLKFYPFQPKNLETGKGMINITEVNQIKDTLYFFAKNISIYSPIYVSIDSEVPDEKINIGIYKMNWLNPNRKGKTNNEGHWETQFKTEMDFGIMVVPEKTPIKYTLLAWSGKEADFELPNTFYKEDAKKNSKDSTEELSKKFSSTTILYMVIALLILLLIFVFIKLKKQKK